MKLFWVKIGTEVLVGETDRSSAERLMEEGFALQRPMVMQYVNMAAPSRIHNGKQPQMVTGFKFITIPCSEIFLNRVDYAGEVREHDPVFITYYAVLKAQKQKAEDPLMISQ